MPESNLTQEFTADQIVSLLLQATDGGSFTAKMGQFRRWQKLGAFGDMSGRGRAGQYDAAALWRACIIDALSEVGLPPAKSVRLAQDWRANYRQLHAVLFADAVLVVRSPAGFQISMSMERYAPFVRSRTPIKNLCQTEAQ